MPGAHAFFLKSMSGDELLAGLRRLQHDDVVIPPLIARQLRQAATQAAGRKKDPFAELTERELEVLRALANGASNARLAQLLVISEKTVKSHIGNILAKLRLSDRTEAVAFAWRNGLMKRTE
ncbi:LuxR family transcriptional regulator [Burkholderia lata]|uniref:LuxR family transcriptional regulator n=1 Tax=Burkholderia lata (strain ATCC 17760 / DSM 23089 / LMG 22485 / NCIMB 9086 / R18194 / 383) TaxID=482957 RepID=A0A6P2UXB3_BURL3|nr:response regulator transcription factor [Burkholderia lata]VWC73364.1 LuxR family transcriptional regulator [Burkholderia lata]